MVVVAERQDKALTCSSLQFPTMSAEDNTPARKLKFKITTKGIRNDSEDGPRQNTVKVIIKNGQRDRAAAGGNKCPEINGFEKPALANSCKRKPETSLDGDQRGERQKMDQNVKLHCSNILKELMNHPDGWIFSEPVDPVKLQIPDYFSVIKEPMDLGTIKHKLDCNMYFGAEGFAADVRRTFSNAMLYNPPENGVHVSAKILDGNFCRRWKSLEAKLIHGMKNVKQASFVDDAEKNCQDTRKYAEKNHPGMKPTDFSKPPLRVKLGTCRPMSFEEKQSLRLELMQVLSRKTMENLQSVLQKFGFTGINKEGLDSYIDSTNDGTLWKLRREIRAFLYARDGRVEPARIAENGCLSLRKTVPKEHCSKSDSASANHRQSIDATDNKCSSLDSLTCHCQLKNGSIQTSISDMSSERSTEQDLCGDSKLDCEEKCPLACHTSSFGPDSDGPGIVLYEENSRHLSTPATTATSVDGWTSFSVQMSPKKALRAAMLKSRFADTIFKATHQAVLDHGQKPDPLRMQQERARLEREQQEERARIEAEIKAAEAASRRRVQDDLKMQRERDRAAARKALEMMERTVEVDENVYILKDLEMLCSFSPPDGEWYLGFKGVHPLEQLGLYIKDDYLGEDEDEDEDEEIFNGEEGEIL